MASDQGAIATETPPAIHPPGIANFSSDKFSLEPTRAKSLKRTRETTPSSPNNTLPEQASPTKSARLHGQTSRHSHTPPIPSPALEGERRWSEDQDAALEQQLVQSMLSSGAIAMSRPQDGTSNPAPAPAPEPQAQLDHAPSVPTANMGPTDSSKADKVSPQSTTSMASMGGAQVTTSPEAMELDGRSERAAYTVPPAHMEDRPGPSLSYPPLPAHNPGVPATPNMPQRTATHPIPMAQDGTPRSPSSNKKHKCPYCDTEFTRHHNLKSHLLTHSQEKPYVCQTCNMRFRRLHDLKRHSKLHTGEKPHTCPKCNRSFARGDALARHSKGAGGCAGRRHSLPGFAGDDDFDGTGTGDGDESSMAGVVYDGANDVEMSEEDRRRLSMSAAQAQQAMPGNQISENAYTNTAAAHGRTYPPAGPRTAGGLFPPNAERGAGTSASNNNLAPGPAAIAANASLYAQSSMTESPKPLSPHGTPANQSQSQQQQFNRRPSDQAAAGLSLPSPHSNMAGNKTSGTQFAHPDVRYGSGQTAGSHSRASSGPSATGGDGHVVLSTDPQVWTYIGSLEERLKQLTEKVVALEKDNAAKDAKVNQLSADLMSLRHLVEGKLEPGEAPPS